MVTIPALSTEYIVVPVSTSVNGTPFNPTVDTVQFAFMTSGAPGLTDWQVAAWEIDPGPAYLAKCLVGPGGVVLAVGVYTVWVKATSNPEVPVQPVGLLSVITSP